MIVAIAAIGYVRSWLPAWISGSLVVIGVIILVGGFLVGTYKNFIRIQWLTSLVTVYLGIVMGQVAYFGITALLGDFDVSRLSRWVLPDLSLGGVVVMALAVSWIRQRSHA